MINYIFIDIMTTPTHQTNTITSKASFLHPYGEEPGSSKKSTNFGIYQVTLPQDPPKFQHLHWILNIDRSASMMDVCPDGKTKMDHLKHTFTNMLEYFSKLCQETPSLNQYLTIIMFDHEVDVVCKEKKIDINLAKSQTKILLEQILPRGATNIEKALTEAAETMKTIMSSPSYDETHQTAHVFMSDGNITAGFSNHDYLKEKLNLLPQLIPEYIATNTFIGYGSGHDAKLMKTLSDIPKGQYYFIDSIENAGMVYGEVLYNSLYEYMKNIKITVTNGEIYDYRENLWKPYLDVSMLPSGQTRTWHIRKNTQIEDKDESVATQSNTPEFIDIPTTVTIMGKINGPEGPFIKGVTATYPDVLDKNVEKYLWRQKTQ